MWYGRNKCTEQLMMLVKGITGLYMYGRNKCTEQLMMLVKGITGLYSVVW